MTWPYPKWGYHYTLIFMSNIFLSPKLVIFLLLPHLPHISSIYLLGLVQTNISFSTEWSVSYIRLTHYRNVPMVASLYALPNKCLVINFYALGTVYDWNLVHNGECVLDCDLFLCRIFLLASRHLTKGRFFNYGYDQGTRKVPIFQ